MIYSIDFETRSRIDLVNRGLDVYANDPSTEVICIAFGTDPDKILVRHPQFKIDELLEHVRNGGKIQAWNAMFEYAIWNCVCVPKYGWPPLKIAQCIDSMATAAANNIPQSLEDAALFLGTIEQKDPEGKKLIMKLSKPQKDGTFNMDPDLIGKMFDYCAQDVRTEMSVVKGLRALSEAEQAVWIATQKINIRGVPVDPRELQNAIRAVESGMQSVDQEIKDLTGGISARQPLKILGWLTERGLESSDLTSETVTKMLQRNNLPPDIQRVLELRRLGSLTSVAKYEKMMEVQVENRIRNTLIYHGASTGRWASRGGLNLQNLARPNMDDNAIQEAIERVLVAGKGGSMEELSSLVRSAIKAPSGSVFVDADFSSIENRVASWISCQDDKVELFRQGLDEYKMFASSSLYRVPYEEVTKQMRQVSKSAVLGCMFGQGPKGLVQYAEGMGVKMTEGQSQSAVDAYRESYAMVKSSWYEYERQAMEAIRNPETSFRPNGRRGDMIAFKYTRGALWMQLPSGRLICWQDPKVEKQLTPWGVWKDGVTTLNQNTLTRKWGRNKLIGSSIFQSAVQGTARDLLAEGLLRLEEDGLEVVNLVHDEILLIESADKAEQTLKHVIDRITQSPKWALTLPIAAEGWVSERYRK